MIILRMSLLTLMKLKATSDFTLLLQRLFRSGNYDFSLTSKSTALSTLVTNLQIFAQILLTRNSKKTLFLNEESFSILHEEYNGFEATRVSGTKTPFSLGRALGGT